MCIHIYPRLPTSLFLTSVHRTAIFLEPPPPPESQTIFFLLRADPKLIHHLKEPRRSLGSKGVSVQNISNVPNQSNKEVTWSATVHQGSMMNKEFWFQPFAFTWMFLPGNFFILCLVTTSLPTTGGKSSQFHWENDKYLIYFIWVFWNCCPASNVGSEVTKGVVAWDLHTWLYLRLACDSNI